MMISPTTTTTTAPNFCNLHGPLLTGPRPATHPGHHHGLANFSLRSAASTQYCLSEPASMVHLHLPITFLLFISSGLSDEQNLNSQSDIEMSQFSGRFDI